jgi:hypothetical protein
MNHEHRHRRIEVLRRANTGWRVRQDHAHFLLSQFAGKYGKERIVTSRKVRFKDNVTTDYQSIIAETLNESIALGMILRRSQWRLVAEKTDQRRRLLRARRERPSCCRSPEKRDELASLHVPPHAGRASYRPILASSGAACTFEHDS